MQKDTSVKKPQYRIDDPRIWAAIFLVFSIMALSIALWFAHAVAWGVARPRFDVIAPAAALGMIGAGIGGGVGSVLLFLGRPAARRTLEIAGRVAGICLVIIVINSIVTFLRHTELQGLHGLWQSFNNFNRIEIGAAAFSITGMLSLILIALAVAGVANGQSKK